MDRRLRLIIRGLMGLLIGIFYYYIYVVLLPTYLIPLLMSPETTYAPALLKAAIIILIIVSIIERVLEHVVVAAFRLLSKLLGAMILYYITNGGIITGTIMYGEQQLHVTVDLSLLMYLIIIASLVGGMIDAGSAIIRYGDASFASQMHAK